MHLRIITGALFVASTLISAAAHAQRSEPQGWVQPGGFAAPNPCFTAPTRTCLFELLMEPVRMITTLQRDDPDFMLKVEHALSAAPYAAAIDLEAVISTQAGQSEQDRALLFAHDPRQIGPALVSLLINRGEGAAIAFWKSLDPYKRFFRGDPTSSVLTAYDRFRGMPDAFTYLDAANTFAKAITEDPFQIGIALVPFRDRITDVSTPEFERLLAIWPADQMDQLVHSLFRFKASAPYSFYTRLRDLTPPGPVRQKLAEKFIDFCPEGTPVADCLQITVDAAKQVSASQLAEHYLTRIGKSAGERELLVAKLKSAPRVPDRNTADIILAHASGDMHTNMQGVLQRLVLSQPDVTTAINNTHLIARLVNTDTTLPLAEFAAVALKVTEANSKTKGADGRVIMTTLVNAFAVRKDANTEAFIRSVPPALLIGRSVYRSLQRAGLDADFVAEHIADPKLDIELAIEKVGKALAEPSPDAFELFGKLPPGEQHNAIYNGYFHESRKLSAADYANLASIAQHWPKALHQALVNEHYPFPPVMPFSLKELEPTALDAVKSDVTFAAHWLDIYAFTSRDIPTLLRLAQGLRAIGDQGWTKYVGEAAIIIKE